MQSGPPFDITSGGDPFNTTLFNARPGIATDPTKPGLILTPYGLLDPNPTPDEKLLPRNFGRGPGTISMNVRIGKTFGFGERAGSKQADAPAASANPAQAATGRGPRGGGSEVLLAPHPARNATT